MYGWWSGVVYELLHDCVRPYALSLLYRRGAWKGDFAKLVAAFVRTGRYAGPESTTNRGDSGGS